MRRLNLPNPRPWSHPCSAPRPHLCSASPLKPAGAQLVPAARSLGLRLAGDLGHLGPVGARAGQQLGMAWAGRCSWGGSAGCPELWTAEASGLVFGAAWLGLLQLQWGLGAPACEGGWNGWGKGGASGRRGGARASLPKGGVPWGHVPSPAL